MAINENTIIKDWYTAAYPTDELGQELNDTITFYGLFNSMDNYKDVYEVLGVSDSLVRERCFEQLAKIMEVDYDYIYNQWLMCN